MVVSPVTYSCAVQSQILILENCLSYATCRKRTFLLHRGTTNKLRSNQRLSSCSVCPSLMRSPVITSNISGTEWCCGFVSYLPHGSFCWLGVEYSPLRAIPGSFLVMSNCKQYSSLTWGFYSPCASEVCMELGFIVSLLSCWETAQLNLKTSPASEWNMTLQIIALEKNVLFSKHRSIYFHPALIVSQIWDNVWRLHTAIKPNCKFFRPHFGCRSVTSCAWAVKPLPVTRHFLGSS